MRTLAARREIMEPLTDFSTFTRSRPGSSVLCVQAIVSNFVRRFQSITTLTAYVTATDDAEWQSRVRTPGDTIATVQGGRIKACG